MKALVEKQCFLGSLPLLFSPPFTSFLPPPIIPLCLTTCSHSSIPSSHTPPPSLVKILVKRVDVMRNRYA